ncbi:MAG TPA: tetratricopeptide repeat protein [Gemmatimonadaceae bacterium]|nr:tetratricopeptide repeat protein [Gemmatimonadaceae bacterium]
MTYRASAAVWGLMTVAFAWSPISAAAQITRRVPIPEGTPRMMVAPFRGNELGLGPKVSGQVIDKLTSDIPIKNLFVIPQKAVCDNLKASGFSCDSTPDPITSKLLATQLRADEYLEGSITHDARSYKLETRMVLTRDNSMVQPLPDLSGAKLGDLVDKLSKDVQDARKQLQDERKCELAVANGQPQDGITAARAAIAAYPSSTIARVCLGNAFLATKSPADSVIAVTAKAVEIDPKNKPALALLADAYKAKYDATKDTASLDKAVDTWAAELAVDSKNLKLVEDVTQKIAASGRAQRAKPIIIQAVQDNPGDPTLIHLKWLILQATKDYPEAAATGEQMVQADTSLADTSYFVRQAALYALTNQPQKAAETTAKGVAKFKNNAALWSLNSQTQRLAGQSQAAVDAANQAIKIDPKSEHVFLRKAQAEMDLKQTDSAVATLKQAIANGEDKGTVGQFLLVLGNGAYQAAADTSKKPAIPDFQNAVGVLSAADSIAPSPQTKFLLGVSYFRIADLAVRQNQTDKKCDLAKTAQDALLNAQIDLQAGGSVDPKTAGQLLGILPKYSPAVDAQVKKYCK